MGLLAVLLAAIVSYLNSLRGEFVFDDIKLIVNNDLIKSTANIPDILLSNLWDMLGRGSNYYRPLPPLLFMALHAIFGLRPEPFHVVSVVLHAGAAGLVFFLARQLVGLGRTGAAGPSLWPALVGGLLFAVHPIHTEAVAWISGVMDLACTFFSLLALWMYIRSDDGELRMAPYVASMAALFLGLLSKEPAVVVPLLCIAYDVLFRRERCWQAGILARRWAAPLGLVVAYLALRAVALGGLAPFRTGVSADVQTTIANVPVLFSRYVAKLIFPVGLNAAHHFHPAASLSSVESLAGVALLALFGVATVWAARADRAGMFALLAFALPLMPSLYLPALSQDLAHAFAERYAYFPSVGLALLGAIALERLGRWRRDAYGLALAVALAITGLFLGMTVMRNAAWKDSLTLWSDSVQKSPNLPLARASLGLALISRGQGEAGRREMQTALRLDPTLADQALESGILAAGRGQFLAAVLAFQTALAYRPDLVEAHYNLAVAYESKGWAELATQEYRTALALRPDHAAAHNNLGILLAQAGRLGDAIRHFEAAIRLRPEDPELRLNLARAYKLHGRPDPATDQGREGNQADPTSRPSR